MRDTAADSPTASPLAATGPRPCVTYFDIVNEGRTAAVQGLLDDYAAAHDLDVIARFQDRVGCVEPGDKPELQKALDLIRDGRAQILLVMSESMISVLAEERTSVCAEIARAGGAVVFAGWPPRETSVLLQDEVAGRG